MIKFDFNKTPITQIADYIIISAAKSNASDIHFDPREDGMMVRTRVDGDLQNFTFIPKAYERNLTTRLKLLANMNITESRLPQDGAIKGNFGGMYLDMRVSCLPLNEGEKVVIRILDYSRSLQGLDSLGFNESNLERLKRMIQVPNGIILITGATGSGKSTTVYSILETLNKEETNIITVEDPIEMNIEGLNQVQVNSEIGMTFAAALRSILRQDPNIILIGEIRDSETAQIAVRAAITGHLVLSTIHTNNTLSTVERLLDMNVERYLLSTALTGIISQRLAKKICKNCRIERPVTKFEKKVFKKYLHKDVDKIWDVNPDGCDACRKGYKGRVAIQEVLELDDEMRSALNNENITKEELSHLVYSDKIITLLQDALGKVLDGTTSFEEVLRVIEIEDAEDFFENDIAEKIKEKQEEKDKEIKEELEKQEEKQEKELEKQEKELEKQKLEEVSLTSATPVTIPTTLNNQDETTVKATSPNTKINSLEKINAIDTQKQMPNIINSIKQDETAPTPFTKTTITNINTNQNIIPKNIVTIPKKEEKLPNVVDITKQQVQNIQPKQNAVVQPVQPVQPTTPQPKPQQIQNIQPKQNAVVQPVQPVQPTTPQPKPQQIQNVQPKQNVGVQPVQPVQPTTPQPKPQQVQNIQPIQVQPQQNTKPQ